MREGTSCRKGLSGKITGDAYTARRHLAISIARMLAGAGKLLSGVRFFWHKKIFGSEPLSSFGFGGCKESPLVSGSGKREAISRSLR